MNGLGKTLPDCDDDTVELVLTAEQMRYLSLAAEDAELAAADAENVLQSSGPAVRPVPATATALTVVSRPAAAPDAKARSGRFGRWHQTPIAKMAASTLAFVAFAWWSVAQLAGQPPPRRQAVIPRVAATAVPVSAPLPTIPDPVPAPSALQVVNPFDSKESFEFPPGTSEDEGREKVAEILRQRALDRQSKWEHIRPEGRLRTASLAGIRKTNGPGT